MTNPSPFPFPIGFHYFCDHRCWRCALSSHCAVFTRWQKLNKRQKLHYSGPAGRVASVLAVSIEVTVEEATVLAAEIERTMPLAHPAVDDCMQLGALAKAAEADPARNARQDPVVSRAAEYAQTCWPAIQAVRPLLVAKGELAAVDALDRLEEMCATIASKVFRAIAGTFNLGAEQDDVQGDANGSAKVALLLIEESRQAWRELMQPGAGIADGLPARFVGVLDAIETALLQRFPRAFEFVRPGFDTGLAEGAGHHMALALRRRAEGAAS
jgi:hypothetical protein